MPEPATTTLVCGCDVHPSRDFLGRTVATIVARGAVCSRDDHVPGRILLMPGREHARPE